MLQYMSRTLLITDAIMITDASMIADASMTALMLLCMLRTIAGVKHSVASLLASGSLFVLQLSMARHFGIVKEHSDGFKRPSRMEHLGFRV